jgi:hypothetical protein
LILVFGAAEIGYSAYQAMEVQDAVEAGALYVGKHGWSSPGSGITAAVQAATDVTGLAASPAPMQFCGCSGSTGVVATSCTSTCSGGTTPGQYVQINASLTRLSLIPNSGLPLPATFSAQSMVRIK